MMQVVRSEQRRFVSLRISANILRPLQRSEPRANVVRRTKSKTLPKTGLASCDKGETGWR